MRKLQLASERLIATGDNTAVEAWGARCKLYIYEDVATGGCKFKFLQQQIALAKMVSSSLARLLELGGKERLSAEERGEAVMILKDPLLANSTLQFCKVITDNYSFHNVLEGSLKRALWHHLEPSLIDHEVSSLGKEFYSQLVNFQIDVPQKIYPFQSVSS